MYSKNTPFFEYELYSGKLQTLNFCNDCGTPKIINTLNAHSFYVADKDHTFKQALLSSDILLPDGVGIVLANYLLNLTRIRKIAGVDIFMFILSFLQKKPNAVNKRIFLLGSSDDVLITMKGRIKEEFPALEVGYYSPPYRTTFSEVENREMIARVNDFKPFALFVGMTAPKQEKWVFQNKDAITANYICSIGAVFDFYSGKLRRPSKAWRILGLEWFGRLLAEPRRLWKRSLISMPYFLGRVVVQVFSFTRRTKVR